MATVDLTGMVELFKVVYGDRHRIPAQPPSVVTHRLTPDRITEALQVRVVSLRRAWWQRVLDWLHRPAIPPARAITRSPKP